FGPFMRGRALRLLPPSASRGSGNVAGPEWDNQFAEDEKEEDAVTITPGYISNSTIVARGDVDCLFYIDKHGHMTPYMDHYLIIPEEMFSARQIKIAMRKWHKNKPVWK